MDHLMDVDSSIDTMSANLMPPPPKARKKKAPTLRESDWAPCKERVLELYTLGTTLNKLKETIEAEFGFHAEVRQYRSRITQWKSDKNVKREEMKHIVRKRQERKLLQANRPELTFQVRGIEVDSAKIERWMNRHEVPESMLYAPSPTASTPSVIDCRTISAASSPAIRSPTPSLALVANPFPVSSERVNQGAADHLSNRHNQRIWDIWRNFSRQQYLSPGYLPFGEDLARCKDSTDRYLRDHPTATKQILWSQVAYRAMLVPTIAGPYGVTSQIVEDALQYWLGLGFDLEHRDVRANTSLLRAAYTSNFKWNWGFKYFRLLIEYGADVHAVNNQGIGAIHLTLRSASHFFGVFPEVAWGLSLSGVEEKLVALLEAGCDRNAKDHLGRTPFQYVEHNEDLLTVWTSALNKTRDRVHSNVNKALPPRVLDVSSPSYNDPYNDPSNLALDSNKINYEQELE